MKPDPVLLEKLATSRFLANSARPSVGIGERPSKMHGIGLEFGGHRPYREGDDMRRLDPRVRARLGQDFVRVYAEDRQLPITIVLDASQSMLEGGREKRELAVSVAQLLAFVGMAGGDQVRVVAVSGTGALWAPKWEALSKSDEMFAWIAGVKPSGSVQLNTHLAVIAQQIPPGSLLLVISDWWTDNLESALLATSAKGHHLVALHIETPEEQDPSLMGDGLFKLVDSETGESVDVVLDASTLASYAASYSARVERLRAQIVKNGGHYVSAVAGISTPRDLFQSTLRSSGIVG